MRESFELNVRRPRGDVFSALTDLGKMAELSQGKVRVTGDGRDCTISAEAPGLPLQDVACRTIEWDPPKKCVRVFDVKDLPITLGLSFADSADGTKITIDVEIVPKSMVYKMMLPMLERKLKTDRDAALAHLQAQLNSQAG